MKDDKLYLIHIRECIQRIEEYLECGGKEAFMVSNMVQDAIICNLQLLSESTMRISDEIQANHPEVEWWYKIRGFRNVLVHDYLGVDLERVWNIIDNDLPKLKSAIEKMI